MEEKNELNDIILNKGGSTANNKKIILAAATLGVILIVVVMLMNTLSSNGTDNLPQAVLPPEPKISSNVAVDEEPLFEEIEVVQEVVSDNQNLDNIAQKLKQESLAEKEEPVVKEVPKAVEKPVATVQPTKPVQTETPKASNAPAYYIQVGSFSQYEPNKKFLKSITDRGYSYTYHKAVRNGKTLNKVLIGPFYSEKKAKEARIIIRSNIEAGAFLIKL
jgi:DedD protein